MKFSKRNNCHEFQLASVRSTTDALNQALADCTEELYSCTCVTHLAQKVAKMMSLKKHEDLKAQGREVGVVVEVEPPKISYSNLLKSISYRCLLDDWMEIHCKVRRDNNTIKDRIKERKLRLDILELSNSNSYLKGVIRELEFRLGADRGSESEVLDFNSDDLDDAYRAIDSLLREFCDLVIIEDSGVAVNNSLRKVLIPSPKFNKYLKWKTRFAKG